MKQVLVIFGGNSFEHDISILTAFIVLNKTKSSTIKLLPVYVSKNNEWFFYEKNDLSSDKFKNFEDNYKNQGFKRAFIKSGENNLYVEGIIKKKIRVDCVLNCCHGGFGENGGLTNALELSNIPVTSYSGVGMGICMDKVLTKYMLSGLNIPHIKFFVTTKNDDTALIKANELGYPLILKPSNLGSSIGIEIAKNEEDFKNALQTIFEFDEKILVEKEMTNFNEYNVACLKVNGEVIVSKVDKPLKSDEILSFKDKYIGSEKGKVKNLKGQYSKEKEFASVNAKIENKLKEYSIKAYSELNLSGVVRIDFIEKKGKIYLNELNTIPGSLGYYFFVPSYFKSMGGFIEALVNEAINDFNGKVKIKREYITKLI